MKIKAIATTFALLAVVGTGAAACSGSSSSNGNQVESNQQQADTLALERNQPLPYVNYSQERQNLIDIEFAEVNNVLTTSFVTKDGNVDPIWSCPSIGFGIPDSASLSNPQQIAFNYNNWNNGMVDSGVIGQMDPNGIYAPTSSEGTWLICLYSNGQPFINRFEDKTDTVGGPAEWDYVKHRAVMTGAPTAPATIKGNTASRKPQGEATVTTAPKH